MRHQVIDSLSNPVIILNGHYRRVGNLTGKNSRETTPDQLVGKSHLARKPNWVDHDQAVTIFGPHRNRIDIRRIAGPGRFSKTGAVRRAKSAPQDQVAIPVGSTRDDAVKYAIQEAV